MVIANAIVEGTTLQAERDAYASAAPSFLGFNVLDDRNADSIWTTTGHMDAGDDITFASEPSQRAHQRKPWTWTSPSLASISGVGTCYFNVDLVQGTDDEHTIDTAAVHILNVANLGAALFVSIQFAEDDDTDFVGVTNPIVNAASWASISTNIKLIDGTIGTGGTKNYQNVRYARIKLNLASGTFAAAPKLVMFMMGRRRQLPFEAINDGFDPKQLRSAARRFTAEFGGLIDHELRSKQAVVKPSFHLSPSSGGLDSRDYMERLFHDLGGGLKTHLYIDRPTETSPIANAQGLWVKRDIPSRFHPARGPFDVVERMSLVEQPPFRASVEGIDGL